MARRTIVKYTVEVSVVENPPDPQAPLANTKMFLYSVQAQPGEPEVVKVQKQPDMGETEPRYENKNVFLLPELAFQAQAFGIGDAMDKASAAVYTHLQNLNAHK